MKILFRGRVKREDLWTSLSKDVIMRTNEYDLRSLSNIVNDFSYISRKSKGFINFYDYLKPHLCEKMLKEYNTKDLTGIIRGYSSTYNLSETFM